MKATSSVEVGDNVWRHQASGMNRGVSVLDLILRVVAFICTLASAIAMGTTNETLPFFTRFIRFRAEYDDLPTFTFFVVANGVVSGYLVLSLPISFFHIARRAANSRVILLILNTMMLALLTAAASASAAIVYLAHRGNAKVNWFAICRQFNSFCERISGSLIGSLGGIILLIVIMLMAAISLSRR